jgi:hypothetical protein
MFSPSNGGWFGGVLPETGQNIGSYGLGPLAEAQMAQDARDAAAARMLRTNRGGGADPTLMGDDFITRWQLLLNPQMPAPVMAQGAPQGAPQGAMPPQAPQSVFDTGAAPAQMFGRVPFGQMPRPQQQPMAPPLSLAPPNPTAAPQEAAIPPNAQPAQGQMPVAQGPDFLDRLGAGFNSFANSRGLLPAIGNLAGGLATGVRQDAVGRAQNNQSMAARAIYGALVSKGHSPQEAAGIAMAAATNPEVAKAVLPDALGTPKNMEELFVRQASRGRGGASGAMGAYGDFISAKKAAETKGEAEGKNAATLPADLMRADQTLQSIDELLSHKGFESLYGFTGLVAPHIPGSDAAGAKARLDQIKGQAFLDAFAMLKGGGQVTEVEGAKATAAKARLDTAQNATEARQALNDFKDAVRSGREKLGVMAGKGPTPAEANTSGWTPYPGGYKYKQVGK